MEKIDIMEFIQNNVVDCDISYRGGSLKINVGELFPEIEDEPAICGAYQNYLGGGIAGSIQAGRQFDIDKLTPEHLELYEKIAECCKQYFYEINNGGGDEYMQEEITGAQAGGYEKNQKMPVSGY